MSATGKAPWTTCVVALLALGVPIATSIRVPESVHRDIHHHSASGTSIHTQVATPLDDYDLTSGSTTEFSYCTGEYLLNKLAITDAAACAVECNAIPTCVSFIMCKQCQSLQCRLSATCTTYKDAALDVDGYMKKAPTPSPTSSLSVAPTPAVPNIGASAAATGDPHLVNVHGQKFDLYQPGLHTLIRIPKTAAGHKTSFLVQALATRLGDGCEDMYFTKVNITGVWAWEHHRADLHFMAEEPGRGRPKWNTFHHVGVKVVHGHTSKGTRYLNIFVRGLDRAKFSIGGLLGDDDHTVANAKPAGCRRFVNI